MLGETDSKLTFELSVDDGAPADFKDTPNLLLLATAEDDFLDPDSADELILAPDTVTKSSYFFLRSLISRSSCCFSVRQDAAVDDLLSSGFYMLYNYATRQWVLDF